MRKRSGEKRNHIRLINYYFIDYGLTEAAVKLFKGVTINLSKVGMCLIVFNAVHEGEKIVIKSGLVVRRPLIIQWVKELDHDIYKVGLRFSE